MDYDPATTQLLFHITNKLGKKDTLRVDLKKPAVHQGASTSQADQSTDALGGGGRKRNAAATNEFIGHDKKTQRARNLGIRDDDEEEDDEEFGEKMEM